MLGLSRGLLVVDQLIGEVDIVFLSRQLNGLGLAGLLGAPLRVILIEETVDRDRASGQALLSMATAIGRVIGAAIVGAVATSAGGGMVGYQAAFATTSTMAALLIGVAWFLRSWSGWSTANCS